MAGSTTALVVQKFHGMGVDVDKDLARILYGATLMTPKIVVLKK